LRDLIVDTDFLTQSQQCDFSIGDLAATFDACPALDRCFVTGTLSLRKQGAHANLRELYLLGADVSPAFLRALASWDLPALERFVISLTSAAFPGPGSDADILRVLAAKRPALRCIHVDGLHDVIGALAAIGDTWTEARFAGDIANEDALVEAVERDALRLRRLEVLALPLAVISPSAADKLRAVCPALRNIDELPALTLPAAYEDWNGDRG